MHLRAASAAQQARFCERFIIADTLKTGFTVINSVTGYKATAQQLEPLLMSLDLQARVRLAPSRSFHVNTSRRKHYASHAGSSGLE